MPTTTTLISSKCIGQAPFRAEKDHGAYTLQSFVCMVKTNVPEATLHDDAMGATGLPQYGDTLPDYPNLICTQHRIQTISSRGADGYCRVSIEVTYTAIARLEDDGVYSIGGTVEQIETQRNILGFPLTVSHTYPTDDPFFPAVTITQTGTIRPTDGVLTFEAYKKKRTEYPELYVSKWINTINNRAWRGYDRYKWKLQGMPAVEHDRSTTPHTWTFRFEFQYNSAGWKPIVRATAPDGSCPNNLVFGVGYYPVEHYQTRDFNELFPR